MTGNPDASLTIDTHDHILPDFFWQETENAQAPVGGLAPLRWSKETTVSFMDDTSIDIAVVSLSTPGVHTGDTIKARGLVRRCKRILSRTRSCQAGPVWRLRLSTPAQALKASGAFLAERLESTRK